MAAGVRGFLAFWLGGAGATAGTALGRIVTSSTVPMTYGRTAEVQALPYDTRALIDHETEMA